MWLRNEEENTFIHLDNVGIPVATVKLKKDKNTTMSYSSSSKGKK